MARAEVANVATPPLNVPVPTGLPPSRKVTVPVGVPVAGATGDTVAEKVTDWPKTEGFCDEVTAVVVFPLTTVTLAEAVPPVPPSVDDTAPVVLFLTPAVPPVTFTLNVHEVLAASVAPDKLTRLVPCVAVMVPPPQDPVWPLGVAITRPAGKLSVKPIPDWLCVLLLF